MNLSSPIQPNTKVLARNRAGQAWTEGTFLHTLNGGGKLVSVRGPGYSVSLIPFHEVIEYK
jgi:hypothetical protein